MNLLEGWFAWGEQGVGGNYIILLFLPKTSSCDCFGTEYIEIIKAFACLGHLASFLSPIGQEKLPGWSLLWALVSTYVPLYIHNYYDRIVSNQVNPSNFFFSTFIYFFCTETPVLATCCFC